MKSILLGQSIGIDAAIGRAISAPLSESLGLGAARAADIDKKPMDLEKGLK